LSMAVAASIINFTPSGKILAIRKLVRRMLAHRLFACEFVTISSDSMSPSTIVCVNTNAVFLFPA
jgi:hypothetical protein